MSRSVIFERTDEALWRIGRGLCGLSQETTPGLGRLYVVYVALHWLARIKDEDADRLYTVREVWAVGADYFPSTKDHTLVERPVERPSG